MKVAIVALAAAGLASAQSKACSAGCISLNAQSTGCSSADDVECLCKPQNISRLQSDLTECLASDCSLGYDRALDEVPQIIRDLCGSVASSSSSSSSGSNGGNGGGITATNSGSMEATASSTGTASQTGSDATQSTMTGSMSTSMAGGTNHTMSNSTILATKTSSGAPASETESETTSEEPSASPSDGSASQAAIGAFVALAAAALAL